MLILSSNPETNHLEVIIWHVCHTKSSIPDNFKRSGAGKEVNLLSKCNHPSSFGRVRKGSIDAQCLESFSQAWKIINNRPSSRINNRASCPLLTIFHYGIPSTKKRIERTVLPRTHYIFTTCLYYHMTGGRTCRTSFIFEQIIVLSYCFSRFQASWKLLLYPIPPEFPIPYKSEPVLL